MPEVLIVTVMGVTSIAAYWFGVHALRLARGSLGSAVARALECLGAMAVFYVVNVAATVVIVMILRMALRRFVSLYAAAELVWLPLSLGQALVFVWWRELDHRLHAGDATMALTPAAGVTPATSTLE